MNNRLFNASSLLDVSLVCCSKDCRVRTIPKADNWRSLSCSVRSFMVASNPIPIIKLDHIRLQCTIKLTSIFNNVVLVHFGKRRENGF